MREIIKKGVMSNLLRIMTVVALAGLFLAATAPDTWAQQTKENDGTVQAKKARHRNPVDRVEVRIASLHEKLKITPSQDSAWNEFAQVMRDNAKDMKVLLDKRRMRLQKLNAVQELKSHAEMAQIYAAGLSKMASAFETFYNTMADEQKSIADQVMTYRKKRRAHKGK